FFTVVLLELLLVLLFVVLFVVVLFVVPAPPFVLALPAFVPALLPQGCHVPLILQNLLPFESVTTSVEPVAFGTFGAVTLGVV
ncbi:hypothetical protein, partial [Kingella kingae]|uniref:hypothetical protein n=1 Tax=Kingella kingae TaxID=504 RepID=UPI002549DFB3